MHFEMCTRASSRLCEPNSLVYGYNILREPGCRQRVTFPWMHTDWSMTKQIGVGRHLLRLLLRLLLQALNKAIAARFTPLKKKLTRSLHNSDPSQLFWLRQVFKHTLAGLQVDEVVAFHSAYTGLQINEFAVFRSALAGTEQGHCSAVRRGPGSARGQGIHQEGGL